MKLAGKKTRSVPEKKETEALLKKKKGGGNQKKGSVDEIAREKSTGKKKWR